MKKYLLLFVLTLLFGCQTIKLKPDYDFKYHEYSYDNSKVVGEIIYDSKTGVYEDKIKEKPDDQYTIDRLYVKLKQKDLEKIYEMYLKLDKNNPNKCIYNSTTGELVLKSTFRFYVDKSRIDDENCNIDMKNKYFNNLWGEVFDKIQSSESYKKAFPEIGR